MHIPDGFISPKLYLPLYAVGSVFWVYGLRRVKAHLDQETIPLLAVLTAFCFVLSLVAIPVPGGTSTHASGVPLLAILFGPWVAFVAVSLVLLMQALLFGAGGVTSLPVNALAMGLVGGVTAWGVHRALEPWWPGPALFLAAWSSVVLSALAVALALGVQPLLAHDAAGQPLFFPFGLAVTLPAVLLPHLLVGLGEGAITLALYGFVRRFTSAPGRA